MDYVFSAFRERRGPFGRAAAGRKGEDEDDDDSNEAQDADPVDPAIARSLEVFDKLLKLLLMPFNAPRRALTAFDLTQYICEVCSRISALRKRGSRAWWISL